MVWAIFFGLIWSQVISHFAVSIGLHRYFSHRQIKVSAFVECLMLYMIMVACVRTPIGWIASHRMHHMHCDTDKDPHSPRHKGFWKVLFTTWDLKEIPPSFARDLFDNPRLVWCHRYWRVFLAVHWILALCIGFNFFVGFALIPFILARVGFGLLNTVGHAESEGSNKPWLNLIIAGEGYHQVHHLDPGCVRLHKYDFGGWFAEKFFEQNRKTSSR